MLGLAGPPQRFGLYRDGNRLAALPQGPGRRRRYAAATLAALPYKLRPHARVLLAGASGGFRIAEARALGAARGAGAGTRAGAAGRAAGGARPVAALRRGARRAARERRADRRHAAAAARGTSSTCPATSSTRPRPIPAPSPPRRSPAICARWRRAASSPSRSPSANFRPTRCACWRPCARRCCATGSPTCRRMCWWSARPGTCASWCRNRPFDAAAIGGGEEVLRRTVVRHQLSTRASTSRRHAQHLQRPAGGFVRGGRGHLGRGAA